MTTSLHQLNLGLNTAEDRLLLRITAGSPGDLVEYRLWLTRRFVKILWKALDHMLDIATARNPAIGPEGREAMKKLLQDDVLSRADFTTPFEGDATQTPLGPDPLLITRFQVTESPEGKQILSLQTATGQGVNLTMDIQLIHSIRKLIADKVTEAQWDLAYDLYTGEAFYMPEVSKSIN